MTTESPMRMVESRGARNWPSSKDAATFGLPFKNMATEELGLLLKEHKFHGDQSDTIPNRSGSAPPSMEGSFAAVRNLLAQQNPSFNSTLTSLHNAIENCVPVEQLRFDPAYFVYYCSNVNLNPRLPPPVISRENQHLVRHIEGFGNNRRFTSLDDSSNGSLHLSQGSLFTHKEEPEDDRSPRQASNDWAENSSALMARQNTALTGRNKSLVDLIQEDFPRTPSPVYNQSRSSSHSTTEEPIDHDVHATSVNIPSINTSKQSESNSGAVHVCLDTCTLDAHAIGVISSDDPLAASLPCMPCPDGTESSPPSQKDELGNKNSGFEDDASISSTPGLGVSRTESRASASNVDNSRNKQEEHQSYKRNIPQHHPSSQQGTLNQVQGAQAEVMSQGMNYSYSGMEKLSHSHPKSSVEGQPTLHSSGFTPPLYANAAAYMTSGSPFYSNFQPPGLFSPQYSMGGYAPFMAGYSSHGAFPMPFDATSGPSYSGRAVGVSTGQNNPHVGDLQHPSKFYGQHGLMMQPSFVDPLQMQYFQHPSQGAYGASGQFGMSVSGCLIGSPVNPSVPQKEPVFAAYMGDQNLHPPTNGSLSIPNQRKGEITGSNYYRSFPSMGVMSQFPASPHASSVMPSSPVGGTNHLGQQKEMRFSRGSIRNAGVYFGWQGHRGVVNSDDPKRHSFLEELKSSNARRFELSDIAGRIVEVCVDQHGSRFIQKKLENCSIEEKASVFKEVILHAPKLMTDVFGNYVIQKFFEHGSPEQRRQLADQLTGQMLPLSLQMYGCRVIQKALEVIEVDQKTQLAHELDGHVMRCVRDQNGNHVIQKCIECLPIEKLGFIISAFQGQVPTLATHPYGCRVVQRVLEHCSDDTKIQCIMDEILESACVLAQDQYGNYVTQHVLERGKPNERSQIISQLTGKIVHLSQHKYSSNVVEKCLEHGDTAERQLLIEEIIGQSEENDNLLAMMKDQFANYVVQKILEICNDEQREVLVNRMRVHFHALKKYTYGKHIVARFEHLSGEGRSCGFTDILGKKLHQNLKVISILL